MSILVVTTGGTICSLASAETGNKNDIKTGAVLPQILDEVKRRLAGDYGMTGIAFEVESPINTLSENMTIELWNELIGYFRDKDISGYEGLIVMHGTDTLHMTAPLLSIALGGIGVPVILVSGHRIITDPESNAFDNFTNAVRMIDKLSGEDMAGKENVFVVYRNMNMVSYVHTGEALEECGDYSEEFFSKGMCELEKWMKEYSPIELCKPMSLDDLTLKDDVLLIKPYVGINYSRYSLDGVRAVLHLMYHSSTLNAVGKSPSSALYMLECCKEAGIPMYIFPCDENSYRYVTTKTLLEAGALPLTGGTWNYTYTKLLLMR
ncbi:MAG: asparaginase [Eubacterium sp.]|nr:asparaginase [Eubacterium sp.]